MHSCDAGGERDSSARLPFIEVEGAGVTPFAQRTLHRLGPELQWYI